MFNVSMGRAMFRFNGKAEKYIYLALAQRIIELSRFIWRYGRALGLFFTDFCILLLLFLLVECCITKLYKYIYIYIYDGFDMN